MTVKSAANGKFLVTPQLEKGKVCLSRGDDQLLHFQWVDRQTGASPEDFIIFPDDAHFDKVDTGRPDDRVYILQYKNSSRRFFFWMQVTGGILKHFVSFFLLLILIGLLYQNKDASRDEELVKKVNDAMNNAQAASSNDGGRVSGNNVQLDHNAIMQMLGAMSAGDQGRGGASGGGVGGGGQAVQMSELQNILQNMGLPAEAQSTASSPATSAVSSSQASQNGGGISTAATTASTQHDHDVSGMEVDEMDEDELLRLAIEESMRDGGSTNPDASGDGAAGGNSDSSSSNRPAGHGGHSDSDAVSAVVPPEPVASSQFTSTAAVAASAPAGTNVAAGGTLTTADLQRAMASFQGLTQPKPVSLTKLLSADNMESVLDDPACVDALLPHLPEGSQTLAELRATVCHPKLFEPILPCAVNSYDFALSPWLSIDCIHSVALSSVASKHRLARECSTERKFGRGHGQFRTGSCGRCCETRIRRRRGQTSKAPQSLLEL
uniref:Pru domain-containing protein n=1 Tax=Hyaloperonospora arabidopsidis (strain Emoy2) TaxID=559515 RepID=M4BQP5_HYAAE